MNSETHPSTDSSGVTQNSVDEGASELPFPNYDKYIKFDVFKNFNQEQFDFILKYSKFVVVPKDKVLLNLAAEHSNLFFLVRGSVQLIAGDNKRMTISDESPGARNPIAQLRPSRYKVTSLTEVELIVLSEESLHAATELQEQEIEIKAVDQEEDVEERKTEYDKILFNFLTLLHTEKLVLPSLPDIAFKIRKAAEDEDSSADDVIHIISMDQAIMAKIIKTANSAAYIGNGTKVDTLKNAYIRLGAKNVINLVISYTMQELFKTDSEIIKTYMDKLWHHSIHTAAISSILARLTPGFDADKALLMGLLHNIGAVVILNNLGGRLEKEECKNNLDKVLSTLQAEVGASLLEKWDFPEDIIEVVENSGDWLRNDNVQGDYSDIVNIAQIHAYIGTPMMETLPPMDVIPGFHKLALGKLTPDMSLQVIEKSQQEIEETMGLFS
ncbi:MAG: HDOD domain-containing protein [Gammaproteobacteria bacterium]|nr:HDOD domain-containing protein [Gammaproteobacteria bacterium]